MSAPETPEPPQAPGMDASGTDAGGGSPLDQLTEHPTVQAHPEILVGAAFGGAFVFAKLLKAAGGRR